MEETSTTQPKLVTCKNTNFLAGNDVKPDLVLDKQYPLKAVYQCPAPCNHLHYDVGLTPQAHSITCIGCRAVLPQSGKVGWCAAVRFV